MTATYTFDVFSSLDGYGSAAGDSDWGIRRSGSAPNMSGSKSHDTSGHSRSRIPAWWRAEVADGARGHRLLRTDPRSPRRPGLAAASLPEITASQSP